MRKGVIGDNRIEEQAWKESNAVTSLFTHPNLWFRLSSRLILVFEFSRFLHVLHVYVIVSQQTVFMLESRMAQHALELSFLSALESLVPLQRYHPSVLSAAGVARVRLETDG